MVYVLWVVWADDGCDCFVACWKGALNEIQGMKAFVTSLKKLGFALQNKDASNKMFVILELTKRSEPNEDVRVQWPTLKACTYKRR
jgi:hypothetical protein